ncbi:g4934 [Coccomyxa viridis]|uniref:G4934 protein n=1 Tax=Coccomyxa viridis TaxID=1274662 RepID=A0ABP1FWI2_9CHLO
MKWAAVCVVFGLCALFVQRTSSVEDQASGLREDLSVFAVHEGQDGVKTGNWRSARYTGRRSLKGGDHYVIVQQDDTPSPPPPSKVIIKKSSPCPSPPPPSSVTNPALQLHHYCM